MGWNGSGVKQSSVNEVKPKGKENNPSSRKWLTIGLVLIIIVSCLTVKLLFVPDSGLDIPQEEPVEKSSPVQSKRTQMPTNEVPVKVLPLNVKRDHSELTVEELLTKVPPSAYSVEDRKRIDPGYAKRHERFLRIQANKTWKTYSDNAIAGLLFNKGNLGAMPPFPPQFKKTFVESLKTPIVIADDDPPEIQEQKRQMIETRDWLKGQMDDGQDIVEILNEEYRAQRKASNLQSTLRQELYQIQKKAKSVQEVDDYVAAANIMLENAGSSHRIKIPTAQIKYRLQREETESKGEQQ